MKPKKIYAFCDNTYCQRLILVEVRDETGKIIPGKGNDLFTGITMHEFDDTPNTPDVETEHYYLGKVNRYCSEDCQDNGNTVICSSCNE